MTRYSYDSTHRLIGIDGPEGPVSSETYDPTGRLIGVTDATGHETQIQNVVGDQTITFTDALRSSSTVLTLDDLGDTLRSDTVSGGVTLTTQFAFDSVGHAIQKTDALNQTVSAAYDAQGDLTRYTDAAHNDSRFAYNSFGQMTTVIGLGGTVLANATYDASGNMASVQALGSGVVTFVYDSSGRMTSRTDAAGRITGYGYDSSSRLTQLSDGFGKPTGLGYDSGNRLTSVTDPLGNVTTFTYDAADNVISAENGRHFSQSYTYSPLGRLATMTDSLGQKASNTYDADGNILTATDRNGATTTFTYDADGHTTRIDYPAGEFLAYTYDGFGRPVTVANGSSSIDNTYDAIGQLTSTVTHAHGLAPVTLSFTYDAAGNRLSSRGPDGTVYYGYDALDRLTDVIDTTGGKFNFGYDTSSRLATLTRPNGVNDSYTYDAAGKLTGVTSAFAGNVIQSITQTFDANGQVSSRTDAGGTTSYTHDITGRLTAVSGSTGSQTYAYDAAGNRTSSPTSAAVAFNSADEMTSDGNFNYSYDAEGQRTSRVDLGTGAKTTYVYNGRHQLTSIQYPDGTSTTYTYDPLGRRLSATTGGNTSTFLYDGLDVRLEYAGASLAASYTGGGQPDRPLEMVRGGSAYFYLQGFQGNVAGLTDGSGAVKANYSYDAFGVPTSPSPGVANPFTYTGREYDAKSGLYYNRARYYESASGSFLSQDPLGGGEPYAYASDDPVDLSDPGGAIVVETASLDTKATEAATTEDKLVGCSLALVASTVEIGINVAIKSPATSEIIDMLLGAVAGCILGSLSANTSLAAQILKFPIYGAIIAGLTDLITQWICASRTGNWSNFSPTHALAVGLGALSVGILASIAIYFLPESMPAVAAYESAIGISFLAGDYAGFLDYHINGGVSC